MYKDFLDILWCFLCGKLTKLSHCVGIAQIDSQQRVASIIIKHHHTILTKRLSVATTDLSGTHAIMQALVYLVYNRIFDPGPSNPGPLLPRWPNAVYRDPNGASPPSTQQQRRFRSLFMILFWDFGPKWCCSNFNFSFVDINSEKRHNVATSSRKEKKISRWVNRHSVDLEASKLK